MIEKIKGGNAKALTPQLSHDSNTKDTKFSLQYQRVKQCFSTDFDVTEKEGVRI